MDSRSSLAFAVAAGAPGPANRESWLRTLVLVRSLRAFGGRLADSPVLVVVPDRADYHDQQVERRLTDLDAQIVSFDIDAQALGFFFAAEARGAAVAEAHFDGEADALAYLVADTLVLGDLTDFLPAPAVDLCYRPVHIANIGSPTDAPIDSFWSLVYARSGVAEDTAFPMTTCVERASIRPYFNSGSLIVRPQMGLLRAWADRFEAVRDQPAFQDFYARDPRYRIFVHQAVLSAEILAAVDRNRMHELPETVNYPRHLHADIAAEHRPERINDLVTCRYEHPFEVCRWGQVLRVDPPLASWFTKTRSEIEPLVDPERVARWRAHLAERGEAV